MAVWGDGSQLEAKVRKLLSPELATACLGPVAKAPLPSLLLRAERHTGGSWTEVGGRSEASSPGLSPPWTPLTAEIWKTVAWPGSPIHEVLREMPEEGQCQFWPWEEMAVLFSCLPWCP